MKKFKGWKVIAGSFPDQDQATFPIFQNVKTEVNSRTAESLLKDNSGFDDFGSVGKQS